jgi:hypothetical protein
MLGPGRHRHSKPKHRPEKGQEDRQRRTVDIDLHTGLETPLTHTRCRLTRAWRPSTDDLCRPLLSSIRGRVLMGLPIHRPESDIEGRPVTADQPVPHTSRTPRCTAPCVASRWAAAARGAVALSRRPRTWSALPAQRQSRTPGTLDGDPISVSAPWPVEEEIEALG